MIYKSVLLSKWIFFSLYWISIIIQVIAVSNIFYESKAGTIIPFNWNNTNSIPWITFGLYLFIVLLLQFLFLIMYARAAIHAPGMLEIYPNVQQTNYSNLYTTYDFQKLVSLTLSLAEKANIAVDRIFVTPTTIPNAFTFSLPFVGSIVVINTNILEIGTENEVRAVIAHELGHVAYHDSLIKLISSSPTQFFHLIYLYIYALLVLGIANSLLIDANITTAFYRLLLLGFVYIVISFLKDLSNLLIEKSFRDAEVLCDYHAAVLTSPEITINMLLKLGNRVEVIQNLYNEFLWLAKRSHPQTTSLSSEEFTRLISQVPSSGINAYDQNLSAAAPILFVISRLQELKKNYYVSLSDSEIQDLALKSAQKLFYEWQTRIGAASDELPANTTIINWEYADVDHSGYLDREEIRNLVLELKKNPHAMLFRNEESKVSLFLDHPNIRKRILFVYDTFLATPANGDY